MNDKCDGLSSDVNMKRATYERRNYEILNEFRIAHPSVKCQINKLYNSSFYGSCIWDLTGEPFDRLCRTWSKTVRRMWDLPPQSHRRLIEPLSGSHIRGELIGGFIGFVKLLFRSPKPSVQQIAFYAVRSKNTIMGGNAALAASEVNVTPSADNIVKFIKSTSNREFKRKVVFFNDTDNDSLTHEVNLIRELTEIKRNRLKLGTTSDDYDDQSNHDDNDEDVDD